MKDFQKWRADTEQQIGDWTNWLFYEALKKGTYNAGIHWLQKNKPEMPSSYKATAGETFSTVIRTIYDDAIEKVRYEAMKRPTNY